MGIIFAEFATSLKSPKIDTAKNNPYYTSSLRVLEIAKIGLSENLAHLPSVIFAKISRREKFPIYGSYTLSMNRRKKFSCFSLPFLQIFTEMAERVKSGRSNLCFQCVGVMRIVVERQFWWTWKGWQRSSLVSLRYYMDIKSSRNDMVDFHPEETLSTEVEPRLRIPFEG